MLKISEAKQTERAVTLKLEGRLIDEWVSEASEVCDVHLRSGRKVKLNLVEVSFVDQEGVKVLANLAARGVTFMGESLFVAQQLRQFIYEK